MEGHLMRLICLNVMFCILLVVGCSKGGNPDSASDDDIWRADARANGDNEEQAVTLAHRRKDESPYEYAKATRQLRIYIKYYEGNEGKTTLEQYVEKRRADIAARNAENEKTK